MRLHFSMLSQPSPTTASQAGTPGTQAFVRLPASPHAPDAVGTSGDNARSAVTGTAEIFEPCPLSPTGYFTGGDAQAQCLWAVPGVPICPHRIHKECEQSHIRPRSL